MCCQCAGLLKLRPLLGMGSPANLHLKGQRLKWHVLAHTIQMAVLTSYKKLSVGYFELKLHITLWGYQSLILNLVKRGTIGHSPDI